MLSYTLEVTCEECGKHITARALNLQNFVSVAVMLASNAVIEEHILKTALAKKGWTHGKYTFCNNCN